MPAPGVTGKANSFLRNIGGKGANQAVAIHNLGGDVFFFGSVGKDEEGNTISHYLKSISIKHQLKESQEQTGTAFIIINEESGENQILIVQGANKDISRDDIDKIDNLFKESDIFLTQLETNKESVQYSIKKAKNYGLLTILNPAPYMEIDDDIYPYIDYFIPNEHELEQFVCEGNDVVSKAKILLNRGVKNVIVTLGEKGSILVNKKGIINIAPHKVKAIDTTAAGDSYVGALIAALSQDIDILDAMNFASKCSSITVTRKGAIQSLPTKEDLV